VGLETITIIQERGLVEQAQRLGAHLQAGLRALADHPLVGEVRGVGLIAAIELVTDKATKVALEKPGQLGALANAQLHANGVICRVISDAVAFCPPLIITEAQIDDLLDRVKTSLDAVAAQVL
jgi:4-aminobutyrate--pyruvate transaminase